MPWAVDPTPEGSLRQAAQSEADWQTGARYHFVSIHRESLAVLGVVGINDEHLRMPELHYWIRSDHAGQGLTTEAAGAVIGWAATALGIRRTIWLWAGRENAASRRVAEKLGFTHVGPLEWRPAGGLGDFDAERYELKL